MAAKRSVPIWLFPVAYLVHVTEEFFGGAGLSLAPHRMEGFNLTPLEFILINCVGASLLLFGLVYAQRRGFVHLLMIILSTIFLVDGLLHLIDSLRRRVGRSCTSHRGVNAAARRCGLRAFRPMERGEHRDSWW